MSHHCDQERTSQSGLTLIELMIAISIAAILVGISLFVLNTSISAYLYSQQEVLLDKTLDECLDEIIEGQFEALGVKDALEIVDVSPQSITVVPLWMDDTQRIHSEHRDRNLYDRVPFVLNRSFRPGAFIPFVEVTDERRIHPLTSWSLIPSVFVMGNRHDDGYEEDRVYLMSPVKGAQHIRIVFHPDAKRHPDCALSFVWDKGQIVRSYRQQQEPILQDPMRGVRISQLSFQYFDGSNNEVVPRKELIPNITAVKVHVEATLTSKTKTKGRLRSKKGAAFVNIRNTRGSGKGLFLAEEMRFKIPDSKNIRVLSLAHVMGFREGDEMILEAHPKEGPVWRIVITFGYDRHHPLLKSYCVEYPPGQTVYCEHVGLSTDLPLNFLTLGRDGRYDYDFDSEGNNVVDLKSPVDLFVRKMDPQGASLFIRP